MEGKRRGFTAHQIQLIRELDETLPAGPWRCLPNPMEAAMYFIAQDRPIEPYNHRQPDVKPAVPQTGWSVCWGLPKEAAMALVEFRNRLPTILESLPEPELQAWWDQQRTTMAEGAKR
jgi:hypothetical protein